MPQLIKWYTFYICNLLYFNYTLINRETNLKDYDLNASRLGKVDKWESYLHLIILFYTKTTSTSIQFLFFKYVPWKIYAVKRHMDITS